MSGFGGAVKLTGESEYRRALNQINQSLRETASEMKAVSSAYASNDKSQSAVSAKADVLNRKLQEQNQKLQTLKAQYQQMTAQYSQQTAKHTALVDEYNREKQKLDEIGRTLGTTSQEYQDQKAKVDGLSQEVAKSTQAQDANEKSMSKMREQINLAQADCNNTARELDNLGKEAIESGQDAEKAGDGFTVFKGILANLGTQVIMSAINGLRRLGGAMIRVGKQALDSYANYEQLVGGVETLFKDSAPIVQQYASEAYRTAGLSANNYMETVTSFASSLIQSLDGDTAKASEVANRAITDMADNANKMGTDIGMLQNAYQGFAKQNYTMLDNLKLGYGGTKTEMQRLIADASQMTDVQKELGITVDESDMSFANIANAISVVQKEMGIMGTTAKEADSTIQGSTLAMQASWQNLLVGMADDTADFDGLVSAFSDSLMTMLDNVLPRIQTIITGMGELAGRILNKVVPELIQTIPPLIESTMPLLVNSIKTMIRALLDILPTVIPTLSNLIPQIVNAIVELLPQIVDAGIQLIVGLIDGITQAIPQLLDMLPTLIVQLVDVILNNVPIVINAGLALVMAMAQGMSQALPQLGEKIPEIIQSIKSMLQTNLPQIIQTTVTVLTNGLPQIILAGVDMMVALIEGLSEALPELIEYLPTIITTVVTVLAKNMPKIVASAIRIIEALIQGLSKALPKLIQYTPKLVVAMVKAIIKALPQIISAGVQIISALIKGIGQMLGKLGSYAGRIVSTIWNAIKSLPSRVGSIGMNLVRGIWNGISSGTSWIKGRISSWVGNVTSFLKRLFKIGSPSKLYRDEIGKNLALGIGLGFTDEMRNVASQMGDAIPKDFDTSTVSGARYASQATSVDMVNAFKQALSEVKIELDDEVAGQFVDKTVTKIIYA